MDAFQALLRETMILVAMLCIPVLAIAALVGTVVAIAQAATQVQEQTLTLLPKVVAVGAAIATVGPFALQSCAALFRHAIDAIPAVVYR